MVSLPDGSLRVPTWFEFRAARPDPDQWAFSVQSGIYPPVPGVRNTHTHLNHDNSRLLYMEDERAGQPVVSQAEYHDAGPVPARGGEDANLAHQQLAFNTAVAASIEWVRKVEEDAGARQAIEWARTWDLKARDPKLAKELEAGLTTQMTLSCAAGKWDGDDPPATRGTVCRSMVNRRLGASGGSDSSRLESEILGLAANILVPMAMRYTGMFWDAPSQYHLLERLSEGIGSDSGRYLTQVK